MDEPKFTTEEEVRAYENFLYAKAAQAYADHKIELDMKYTDRLEEIGIEITSLLLDLIKETQK